MQRWKAARQAAEDGRRGRMGRGAASQREECWRASEDARHQIGCGDGLVEAECVCGHEARNHGDSGKCLVGLQTVVDEKQDVHMCDCSYYVENKSNPVAPAPERGGVLA